MHIVWFFFCTKKLFYNKSEPKGTFFFFLNFISFPLENGFIFVPVFIIIVVINQTTVLFSRNYTATFI